MKGLILTLTSMLALSTMAQSAVDAASIKAALDKKLNDLERTPEAREQALKLFSATSAEIDAYIAANPEAKDKLDAQVLQVQLWSATGETEKVEPLVPNLYKQIKKGKEGAIELALPLMAMQARSLGAKGEKKAALALLDSFETDFAEHPKLAEVNEQFLPSLRGQLNQPEVGDTMEISFTATDGSKVDLAALKGKVVLVDFWATWCGPCVAELPHVKKIYSAYHDKGFEVIGISLDEDRGALEAFLSSEKLPWPQAFDGMGWGNEFARKYGVGGIPATFLIGKDGKVVATDLRGPALEEKVDELLK